MFVFFFNQKTAFEVRISDWSSDVCSSDLVDRRIDKAARFDNLQKRTGDTNIHRSISLRESGNNIHLLANNNRSIIPRPVRVGTGLNGACARVRKRSEERRGGTECAGTWRSRWTPITEKKNTINQII